MSALDLKENGVGTSYRKGGRCLNDVHVDLEYEIKNFYWFRFRFNERETTMMVYYTMKNYSSFHSYLFQKQFKNYRTTTSTAVLALIHDMYLDQARAADALYFISSSNYFENLPFSTNIIPRIQLNNYRPVRRNKFQ